MNRIIKNIHVYISGIYVMEFLCNFLYINIEKNRKIKKARLKPSLASLALPNLYADWSNFYKVKNGKK